MISGAMNIFKVGLIGCGLMGQKRAAALPLSCELSASCDIKYDLAEQLASKHPECQAYADWLEVIKRKDLDIIIISTIHALLAPIALAAIEAGKHVLLEKPGAISTTEIADLIDAQKKSKVAVQLGFNHRQHPAVLKAKQLVQEGVLGPVYYIRANYGHGARVGYQNEWRMDKQLSGGGQLIDQGMHLIDLTRWFLGEFSHISGRTHSYYWSASVEDNAFVHLETVQGQTAFLHTSLTEWKNRFIFEIIGRDGKLDINGLGGSYGTESLTLYKMLPEMGPPETTIWEFPFADSSWKLEMENLINSILAKEEPCPNLFDAQQALAIVEKII